MALVSVQFIVSRLSPPLDGFLVGQLVDEFVSLERRYILRDWEPAELDGGQFAEVLARIIYHQDSGNLNLAKSFDDCVKYVENDQAAHAIQPRHTALHIARVLKTAYKFRSQRGAVHISPNYSPNHMDARLIMECSRWCMNEALRVFWKGDREEVARSIREILQFEVPCIGKFEDTVLVQRTDLSAEEEVVVLLHYGGEQGLSRTHLGRFAQLAPSSITTALNRLTSPASRQAIQLSNGNYRLTDLGAKRVRDQLASKLVLE
jgi:hypothetical protein